MSYNRFSRLFLIFIFSLAGVAAKAQIISTFAGINDSAGYAGDHGPATNALLNKPYYVVVDDTGNVYFTELGNNVIRKVSTSGVITTIAGRDSAGYAGDGGPATAAIFNSPASLGIDGIGNLYVSDWGNNRVRKIDTAHNVITVAGTGVSGFSGDGSFASGATFRGPIIAVDRAGDIYISDVGNYRIRKVNTLGIITTIAGTGVSGYSGDGGPAINAKMNPNNIGVDPWGAIYYSDAVNPVYRVIRKIDTAGVIHLFADRWAQAFAFDKQGFVYYADDACMVRRSGPLGDVVSYAGTGLCDSSTGNGDSSLHAKLHNPVGVAFDSSQNLYIAELNGACVRRVGYYFPLAVNNVNAPVAATLKVFPNPATDAFTVELAGVKDEAMLCVYDITGRIVANRSVRAGNDGIREQFNVSGYSPGAYIIRISAGGNTYREKVLVR